MATPRTYPTSNDAARLTHAAWDAAESMDFDALEKWEREHETRAEPDAGRYADDPWEGYDPEETEAEGTTHDPR